MRKVKKKATVWRASEKKHKENQQKTTTHSKMSTLTKLPKNKKKRYTVHIQHKQQSEELCRKHFNRLAFIRDLFVWTDKMHGWFKFFVISYETI